MINIFTSTITPRLEYSFYLIFKTLLNLDYTITSNKVDFRSFTGFKISYAQKPINDEVFFYADDLLFERNIRPQVTIIHEYKELKAFFFHHSEESILPFDPFALIFYLASRYEEYLPTQLDKHNRFSAVQSIAYQEDFLHQPLINLWAIEIGKILKKRYPPIKLAPQKFQFIPTYDIDHAWAFKNKGWTRNFGNFTLDFFKGNWANIKDRIKVQTGQFADPFFTFNYLEHQLSSLGLSPIYFFLVGKYGHYDKNVPISNPNFQQLIRHIGQNHNVGLHPSYHSHSNANALKKEFDNLAKVTGKNITDSRQHFLLLRFPDTYRQLIALGIKNDYTMGYADQLGFRASLATPFPWYDLEKECQTPLIIHPFQVMDVTLRHYLQLTPNQAIEQTLAIRETTKQVGGTFMTLWHNNSLSEYKEWVGWRHVHEEIMRS